VVRRPPRSTLSSSSAASDVYKRQEKTPVKEIATDRQSNESGQQISPITIAAVSYTHLRAHETPEHLVCRLLLEKKKKNTQNQKTLLHINKKNNTSKKSRN